MDDREREEREKRGLSGKEIAEHFASFTTALISNLGIPEKAVGLLAVEKAGWLLSYMVTYPDMVSYAKKVLQKELQIIGKMLEFIQKNPDAGKWDLVDYISPIYQKFGDELLALANEYQKKRIPQAEDFDDKFMKDLKIRMPEANA